MNTIMTGVLFITLPSLAKLHIGARD